MARIQADPTFGPKAFSEETGWTRNRASKITAKARNLLRIQANPLVRVEDLISQYGWSERRAATMLDLAHTIDVAQAPALPEAAVHLDAAVVAGDEALEDYRARLRADPDLGAAAVARALGRDKHTVWEHIVVARTGCTRKAANSPKKAREKTLTMVA